MRLQIKKMLTNPRNWFGVSLAMLVAAFVGSYLAEQQMAERILAEKADMPEPVFAQALNPLQHANDRGEVSVIGEVDFSRGEIVETTNQKRYFYLPVFDVSLGGRHKAMVRMLEVFGDGSEILVHRPVARSLTRSAPTGGAVFVFDVSDDAGVPTGLSDLGLLELGEGFHGRLVAVTGMVGDAGLDLVGGIAEVRSGDIVVFAQTVSAAASTPGANSAPRTAFVQLFLAALASTISVALAAWSKRKNPSVRKSNTTHSAHPAVSRTNRTSVFEPITSQDDIQRGDQLIDKRPMALSRGLAWPGLAGQAARRLSASVRNRR